MVLGGFPQMIDILAKAREMGIYTVVADREESSPAKRFADLSVNISTDDVSDAASSSFKSKFLRQLFII